MCATSCHLRKELVSFVIKSLPGVPEFFENDVINVISENVEGEISIFDNSVG